MNKIKLQLGLITKTVGVSEYVAEIELLESLRRHQSGDWGDVCEERRRLNEEALRDGFRILSVYHAQKTHRRYFIITEADRSVTTILLPNEY